MDIETGLESESMSVRIGKPTILPPYTISIGDVSVSEGSQAFVGVLQQGDLILNNVKDALNAYDYFLLKPALEKWLDPPAYESHLLKYRGIVTAQGTDSASWILRRKEYGAWQFSGPNLWICGRPGSGKSVIASSVVQQLLDSQADLEDRSEHFVGYAFCSWTDPESSNASAVLRGILSQIVSRTSLTWPQKKAIMETWQSSYTAFNRQPDLRSWLRLLEGLLKIFKRVDLVLDGLDECDDALVLVEQLIHTSSNKSGKLRLLFVSQKTTNLLRVLEASCPKIDMDATDVRELTDIDIKQYIRGKLAASNSKRVLDNIESVSSEIIVQADGMFLWAAFAAPEIVFQARSKDLSIYSLLDLICRLPEKMHDMFLNLLKRVTQADPDLGPKLNERIKEDLLILLRWTFHASRPMSLAELQIAMSLPSGTVGSRPNSDSDVDSDLTITSSQQLTLENLELFVNLCYPLLSLQDGKLRLLHSTFREFVDPKNTYTSAEVTALLGSTQLQAKMASACLQYLSKESFKYSRYIRIDSSEIDTKFPFFDYAVTHWISHLKALEMVPQALQKRVSNFLMGDNAMSWLDRWNSLQPGRLVVLQSQLLELVKHNRPDWALRLLIECVEKRKTLDNDSIQTLQITSALGTLYKDMGMLENAQNELTFILLNAKTNYSDEHLDVLSAQNDLANVYCDLGNANEAEIMLKDTLLRAQNSVGRNSAFYLLVKNNLGAAYHAQGKYSEGSEVHEQVYETRKRIFGHQNDQTLVSLNNFATSLLSLGKSQDAKTRALEAQRVFREIDSQTSLGALTATQVLAAAEYELGNYSEALELQNFVWEARSRKLGRNHPDTLVIRNNMALSLQSLDRLEESAEVLREVMTRKLDKPPNKSTLIVMDNLAIILSYLGRHAESAELHEKVSSLRAALLGKSHPETTISMNNLAASHLRLGLTHKAEEPLIESLKTVLNTKGPAHPFTMAILSNISHLCAEQSRLALAEELMKEASEIAEAMHGELNGGFMLYQIGYARVLRLRGKWQETEAVARKILTDAESIFGRHHSICMKAKALLAGVLRDQSFLEEAERFQYEVLDEALQTVGRGSGPVLDAKLALAITYDWQKQRDVAHTLMEEVYHGQISIHGPDSIEAVGVGALLAKIKGSMGELKDAETLASKALDMWIKNRHPLFQETTTARQILGNIYFLQQDFDKARRLQSETVAARRESLGGMHPWTLGSMYDLAKTLFALEYYEEALILQVQVLHRRKQVLRTGHESIANSEVDLAATQRKLALDPASMELMTLSIIESEPATEPTICKAFREGCEFFGVDHPQVLRLKRRLALFYEREGIQAQALLLTEQLFHEDRKTKGDLHADTLETLGQLLRLDDNDKSKIRLESISPGLIWAVKAGNLALVEQLLKAGADKSYRDPESKLTALALAVRAKNEGCVRKLLEHGANPNNVEVTGSHALWIAAFLDAASIARVLLAFGALPNVLTTENENALEIASKKGHLSTMKELLKCEASPDRDGDVMQPLHITAYKGYILMMEALLDAGANIHAISGVNLGSRTPLHAAVLSGKLDAVKLLVKKGADMQSRTGYGLNALQEACSNGHKDIVSYLLDAGQDPEQTTTDGFAAVHLAAERGHVSVLEELLSRGANIRTLTTTKERCSALALAAHNNKLDVVRLILLKDPDQDINEKFAYGATALRYASQNGHVDMVQELLRAGADPNIVPDDELSSLKMAVIRGHDEVVQLLLMEGANPTLGYRRSSPLHIAVYLQKSATVKAILASDMADLNPRVGDSGNGALHLASYKESVSLVSALLERDADVNLKNFEDQTALHIACQRRCHEVIQVLLRHGASSGVKDCFGYRAADWVANDAKAISLFDTDESDIFTDSATRSDVTRYTLLRLIKDVSEVTKLRRLALFSTIARCLIFLGDFDAAVIAAEQSIEVDEAKPDDWKHYNMCDWCPDKEIKGTAYACKTCGCYTFCEECIEKCRSGLNPPFCSHTGFLAIPRPCWKDLAPETVDTSGMSLEDWLYDLERRYSIEA